MTVWRTASELLRWSRYPASLTESSLPTSLRLQVVATSHSAVFTAALRSVWFWSASKVQLAERLREVLI